MSNDSSGKKPFDSLLHDISSIASGLKSHIDVFSSIPDRLNSVAQPLVLEEAIIPKRQIVIHRFNPSYDPKLGVFTFMNKHIKFTANSNQGALLKVLFESLKSTKKTWSWDEIVEKWGENPEKVKPRIIYDAARKVNDKIAIKTTIDDFLTVTTHTTVINPIYLY